MSTEDNDKTEEERTVLPHPYDADDLTIYTVVLAIVSIIAAFTPAFWVSITAGIAAAILFAADVIGKRLIDIRLAIEEKPNPHEYANRKKQDKEDKPVDK